ncbi:MULTISPECIES: hypothetical protein [unclassified Beijerinckia]|uniref:hypothetical protein n=1 Tax=unclassified Beijerinckia TaxID=2638183 RepID=UPI001FCD8D95|nr:MULTISPECIES: hypothetical protein [unclassified Beijerinckia]
MAAFDADDIGLTKRIPAGIAEAGIRLVISPASRTNQHARRLPRLDRPSLGRPRRRCLAIDGTAMAAIVTVSIPSETPGKAVKEM